MALKKIDKITVWKKQAPNKFGERAFTPPVEASVRWDDKGKMATTEDGVEFFPSATIYFDEANLIAIGDRVLNTPLDSVVSSSYSQSFIVRAASTSRNSNGTRFLFKALVASNSNG